MGLKRKHMTRWEWPPVRKAALRMEYVESSVFTGAMGLLTFVEPVAPVRVPGLTIADRGYEWLQAAPSHGRWWLTAMWNGNGRYFQSYFDMTLDVDFPIQGIRSLRICCWMWYFPWKGNRCCWMSRNWKGP